MSRFNRRLGSTTKVDLESVFYLVQALDRQEKQFFSLFIKMIKGRPRFLEMYEQMQKMRVFSSAPFIRGELKSLRRANLVAKDLANRIIGSQLHFSQSTNDKVNFIVKAMQYGVWEMVPPLLEAEMKRCYKDEEYHQLLGLYNLKDELFRLYGIEIDPDVEWDLPKAESLLEIIAQIRGLSKEIRSMRVLILWPKDAVAKPVAEIEDRYKTFFALSHKAQRLYRDLRVKLALVKNDFEEVEASLSEKLFFGLNSDILGGPVESLLDLNLMVHFLALVGKWDKAREIAQLIPTVKTNNLGEESLRLRVEAESRVAIAERSWDLEETRKTLQWFRDHESDIPPEEYNPLLYQLATSLFANGAWKEAGKILSQLDNLPKKYFDPIAWKTLCLITVNHIERENFDMVEYYEDRGIAEAQAAGLKLPELYFKFFRRVAVMGPDDELDDLYTKCIGWFLPLLETQEEGRTLWDFDFFFWMEAKLRGMTLLEYRETVGREKEQVWGAYHKEKHLGGALESYIYPNWWILDE